MFSDPQKNIDQFSVDPGMKVADLGSGAGFYSLALARTVGGSGIVYAVDIQQELLEKLKRQAKEESLENIEVVWSDIDEPNGSNLADGSVDRVVVANVLFQLENLQGIADESMRIVKQGGMVLVTDWSDSFGGLGPQPSRIVSSNQAQALFEQSGLSLVREISAGDHHYGLVFKKN